MQKQLPATKSDNEVEGVSKGNGDQGNAQKSRSILEEMQLVGNMQTSGANCECDGDEAM